MIKFSSFLYSKLFPSLPRYRDKRDKDGRILFLTAYKMVTEIINIEFQIIKNTKYFNELVIYFETDLVKSFFLRELRFLVDKECHYLVSKNYSKNYTVSDLKKNFCLDKLIYNSLKDIKLKNILNIFKKEIKKIYQIQNKKDLNKNHHSMSTFPKIGIFLVEGINSLRRSDIYWLKNSNINKTDIVVYNENFKKLIKESEFKFSENKKSFCLVDLSQFKTEKKVDELKKLESLISKIKSKSLFEKWIKTKALELINRVNYWSQFFKKYNIKIHIDNSEENTERIVKQIALKFTSGISIGKVRSYPMKSYFEDFVSQDVFFCWGEDSLNEMYKTNNPIKNFIISGFPYQTKSKKIIKNSAYFKILILDNAYSNNEGFYQRIYTPFIQNFYKRIFNFIENNENIKIVIKPKKIFKLPFSQEKLNSLKLLNKIEIIEDGRNELPSDYVNDVNLVIATSVWMPSAMMECIIKEIPCIFCDYAFLKKDRPDLYNWGYKKTIFNSIEEILEILSMYIKDQETFAYFGNWKKYLNQIDPFRDNEGSMRIGYYINTLLEEIKINTSCFEAIKVSNTKYLNKFKNSYQNKNIDINKLIVVKTKKEI